MAKKGVVTMNQYLITVWSIDGKYSYLMGSTDIESYKKTLRDMYDRFTVEERPSLNANLSKCMRE
jgi:hypothetical protein